MILNNKKALTFGALLWMIGFVALFVAAIVILGGEMNDLYDKNYDLSYGIISNDTLESLQSAQESLNTDTTTGQSSYSTLGILTLTTLPKIVFSVLRLVLDFVTGGWIDNSIGAMGFVLGPLGNTIIILFRALFTIFIIFILIKLLTRTPT